MITGSSLENTSNHIKLLPEHLVDQIKAGEVIERPASLIKEIIENSLDAESTQIELHLINNGLDLISLEDNGNGMSFEDLPYAFCRHATSKISRFEDLYSLKSFGFRGEALASIASIAKVTCSSAKKEDDKDGGKIVFQAGREKAHERQENLRKGTSLFIKDLFFNTPARLKFIKSAQSEKNAIKRVIDSFIIANPLVKFIIKWDDEDKVVYPATNNPRERVAKLFNPRKKNPEVWEFSGQYEGHKVYGYLSQNSTRGNAHKKNFLFGNSRLFTDRQIHQTILRSAEGHYPIGESGHYCVFIDVPESLIDVNVHPNKTQIKFFKLSVITALLSSEIKKISTQQGEQSHFWGNERENKENSPSPRPTNTSVDSSPLFNQSPLSSPSPQDAFLRQTTGLFQLINSHPPYLLHKEKLIHTLYSYLQNMEEISDTDFIPLLICEPLETVPSNFSQQELLETLEKRGFLCEFLDESSLTLRGYHQVYSGLGNIHLLAQAICREIQTGDELNIHSFSFTTNWVMKVRDLFGDHSNQFILPLDENFIKQHFSL